MTFQLVTECYVRAVFEDGTTRLLVVATLLLVGDPVRLVLGMPGVVTEVLSVRGTNR